MKNNKKRCFITIITIMLIATMIFTACGKKSSTDIVDNKEISSEELALLEPELPMSEHIDSEPETTVLIAIDKDNLPEEISEDMLIYDDNSDTYFIAQETMTEIAQSNHEEITITDTEGNTITVNSNGNISSDTGAVVTVNAKVEEKTNNNTETTNSATESETTKTIIIDTEPTTKSAEEVTKQIADAETRKQEKETIAVEQSASKNDETTTVEETTKAKEQETTKVVEKETNPSTEKETESATTKQEETTKETQPETTAHTHNYTAKVTKAATCTTTGVKTYTCLCGNSYTESIPAIGHKYSNSVVAPTTTAQGYTLHKCSVCGDSYKDSYVAKLEEPTSQHVHTWVDVTTTVNHPAEYKTVHHDAEYKWVEAVTETVWVVDQAAYDETVDKTVKYDCYICMDCGERIIGSSILEENTRAAQLAAFFAHCDQTKCGGAYMLGKVNVVVGTETIHHDEVGHWEENVISEGHYETVKEAYDEKVLVKAAWTETVVTGKKCSGCGETK